jgi:hypothetical protein
LFRDATTLAKRDEEAKRQLEKAPTLTCEEGATIAGQACYDVLADHDAGWSDPDQMSVMAPGLQGAFQTGRKHRLNDPEGQESPGSVAADPSPDAIRAVARRMETQAHADMLKPGPPGRPIARLSISAEN